MDLTEAQAFTVTRALAVANKYLADEAAKIGESESSEFIKAVAYENYNKVTEEFTKLHLSLAEAFPALTQGKTPE